VLPSVSRQPRPVKLSGHWHVGLVLGPGPGSDDLSLGADVHALAGATLRGGLPEPSAAQLVLAEFLAGAQVGEPPAAPEECAGCRAGRERREEQERVPAAGEDRESAQQ
jgi:hypothetical protein